MPTIATTPADDANERLRIRLGSSLVITSIAALVACLLIVTLHVGVTSVTDAVALLGTVTTFLGGVIGVFFGISANSAAHSQSSLAAADVSKTAGKAVDAATAAMGQMDTTNSALTKATQEAHFARGAFQDALRTFQAGVPGMAADRAPATDLLRAVGPVASDRPLPVAGDEDEPLGAMTLPAGHALILDELSSVTHLDIATTASPERVFNSDLLRVAGAEADAHVSRAKDRPRVTEYLKLLGLGYVDDQGVPTRYCAAGVTWAACRAYCDANRIAYDDASRLSIFRSVLGDVKRSFKPSASCPDIMSDSVARGTWAPASSEPEPGYLALYNWQGGQQAQHIGIVVGKSGADLQTIEFNTTAKDAATGQSDGGAVARRTRSVRFVLGYVKTY